MLVAIVVGRKLEGVRPSLEDEVDDVHRRASRSRKISEVITTTPIDDDSVEFRISARGGHATFFISPWTSRRYCRGPVRSTCGFGDWRRCSGARGLSEP